MGCNSSKTTTQVSLPKDSKSTSLRNSKSVSLNALRKDCLKAHNSLRFEQKLPPVQISEELNRMAQTWADNLAQNKTFQHSPMDHRQGAGENLAGHSDLIGGHDLVQMWTVGKNSRTFGEQQGIAHVTHDVCSEYTHIGLGRSRDKGMNGMYIYVANYLPGNGWITELDSRPTPRRQ